MDHPDRSPPGAAFRTTHWSGLLLARGASDSVAAGALNTLCRTYWPPVYAFIRRRGYGVHQVQDLTQGFFARFLEKDYLSKADRNRGRFRSLLISSVENYLHNEHEKAAAQKTWGRRSSCLP
jgi:DNA-directed RNA polymerase specialized sigma24 family protein